MPQSYDVIIIGLGGMGSSAAYELGKRGLKVLGLEQFEFGHAHGSSHGHTRLIRRAYFEHPDYVPLLHAAYDGWRDLEAVSQRELMVLNGLMMAGAYDSGLISGSMTAAKRHDLPLEMLKPEDARVRFEDFDFSDDMRVLLDPGGGFLHVDRCVSAQIDAAHAVGATLIENTTVRAWSSDGSTVSVTTDSETFNAQSLAVCAGAWTSKLLQTLGLELQVERAVTAWFRPLEGAYHLDAGTPVFAYETPYGFFYGTPQFDDCGVKVAEHRGLDPVEDPDRLDRTPAKTDLPPVQKFIAHYMPSLIPIPLDQRVCMYTMSSDSHFIVDTHPEYPNVHFACGFSGHGFKFSPAIGRVLADYVEHGRTELPAQFLTLSRFR